MKKRFTARILLILGVLTATLFSTTLPRPAFAAASIQESYVILNGIKHDVNATTGNPDFVNVHLGTVNAAAKPLVLSGGEVKTASDNGSYVLSARLNYRIYPTGSPGGSFTPLELLLAENLGSGNERWALTGMSIDLLAGLTPGNYTLELSYDATTNGTNTANPIYDSNGGLNYKATFTLAPIYVNINQPNNNGDGFSWATAKRDLQNALAMANPAGTQIWVAAGTYYPDEGWSQADNARESTFSLKNNVAVYGGFAGTETQLSQRNPTTNLTLLSGDVDGDFTAEANAYHVVTSNGNTATAILDGFTISSGNASGSDTTNPSNPENQGGGIYAVGGSQAQFTNLTIHANNARYYGGGVYNGNSSPSFTNVTISYNTTTLDDDFNQRERGGGVYNDGGSPSFTNVTIGENQSRYGGGVGNYQSSPRFTNATISGNFVNLGGGGVHNNGSSPSFTNTLISGNRAYYGGAMRNDSDSYPKFVNTTISANSASFSVGGVDNFSGEINFINSIVWSNTNVDGSNSDPQVQSPGTVTYTNSLVQNATLPGTGNLPGTTDPLFVSPVASTDAPTSNGDYRLQATSPVIDKGSDAANATSTDRDGNPRNINQIDLGAYERQPLYRYVDESATGVNNGTSWTNAFTKLQDALAATSGKTWIWVADGMYHPDEGTLPTDNDRSSTFALQNGVAIYGGFAGGETQLSQRNPVTNVTILSGDLDGNSGTNTDRAYHVITSNGNANTAILDGFTITEGNAESESEPANSSNPENRGGGISTFGGSQAQFTNLIVYANSATFAGGGIYNDGGSPSFTNLTINTNGSDDLGGGVFNANLSTATFTNVTIRDNYAVTSGGGVYNQGSNANFTNVTLSGNSAFQNGGGVYNDGTARFVNTIISGNTADTNGGGVYNSGGLPLFINVTIGGNLASNQGGGVFNASSNASFTNSIIWGNTSQVDNTSSTPTYANSLVEGLDPGGTNLNGTLTANDPRFVAPLVPPSLNSSGNYRLQATSPVANVGDNALNTTSTDRDGRQRIIATTIDLGAYELPLICGVVADASYSINHNGVVTISTAGATMGNLDCLYLDMIQINHPNATPGIQTGRFWTIRGLLATKDNDASGFSGLSLTLPTLFTPTANDKLCRYTGSGWDCAVTSFDAANKTVTRTGIAGFSDWAVGDDVGPTAITLLDFSATREANSVRLNWTTGSELNTAGFRLERGLTNDPADAIPLEAAGFIPGEGDVIGAEYAYLDRDASAAADSFYWLIEIERDGSETRYGPVRVAAGVATGGYRVMLPLVVR